MKVGIDARFLTHPQLGGFKTYTVNLIRAIQEIDHDNHYYLYLDREPTDNSQLPQQKNFTYRIVGGSSSVIGMPLREQIKLPRQIRRDDLDLVHFLCNTATLNIDRPYLITLHDTIQVTASNPFHLFTRLSGYKRWAISAYSKWTIENRICHATKIITVSNYEKIGIERLFQIASEKICVTHLAPNPIFKPASPKAIPGLRKIMGEHMNLPERYILGVGYEPRKNIPLLIETFAKLAIKEHDLHLVIVAAEDSRRAYFRQIALNLEVGERVLVLGMVSPDVLAILYNMAQVFVYPSERESFGLPPLEAIACGTPTIAMSMTSLPEILEDGACFINGKDLDAWSQAIGNLLSDDLFRQDLAKRGLARATILSWRRCAEKTLDVYQTVFDSFKQKEKINALSVKDTNTGY